MNIEPKVLKGFRDILPFREMEKQYCFKRLREVFERFGFVPIDTPALEYTEVLLGKGGGETDKQLFRFQDQGRRDVALRFDLTVPLARYIARHHQELPFPFKRYHMAKVWRGEKPQAGRYREFVQCDFDIIGPDNARADFEILLLINAVMKALGLKAVIRLNHRGLFNRFLDRHGLLSRGPDIFRIVDKLLKIGREAAEKELRESLSAEETKILLRYIVPEEESFTETLLRLENLAGGEEEDSRRLRRISEYLKASEIEDHFVLSPHIVRGLDYYTDLVYETFLTDLPDIGSVCSGGRYNGLTRLYNDKENFPGIGSSLGLDRLLAALEILDRSVSRTCGAEILIFALEEASFPYYDKLLKQCHEKNRRAEIFLETKKLNAQFKYAEKKKIPWGFLAGAEEREAGTLHLKNLQTRETFRDIRPEEAFSKLEEYFRDEQEKQK